MEKKIAKQIEWVRSLGVFDDKYYLSQFEDGYYPKEDSIEHYFLQGYSSGKNPNIWFDTDYYLDKYSDVKESGNIPFYHYLLNGYKESRLPNPSISEAFIKCMVSLIDKNDGFKLISLHMSLINDDEVQPSIEESELKKLTLSFLEKTGLDVEGSIISPYFDAQWYSECYSVPKSKALLHFFKIGQFSGLSPCSELQHFASSASQSFKGSWFIEFLNLPSRLRFVDYDKLTDLQKCYEVFTTQLLDVDWYHQQYQKNSKNAYLEFCTEGIYKHNDPNCFFDQSWYANKYELSEFQLPLVHYLKNWQTLKFHPSESFNIEKYMTVHASLLEGDIEPLSHALKNVTKKLPTGELGVADESSLIIKKDANSFYFDYYIKLSNDKLIIVGWELQPIDLDIATIHYNSVPLNLNVIFKANVNRPDVNSFYQKNNEDKLGTIRVVEIDESLRLTDNNTTLQVTLPDSSEYNCPLRVEESAYIDIVKAIAENSRSNETKEFLKLCLQDMWPFISHGADDLGQHTDFFRMHIESASLIPNLGVFIKGWVIDTVEYVNSIYMVQGDLFSTDLYDNAESFSRIDVCQAYPNLISSSFNAGIYGLFKHNAFNNKEPFKLAIVTNSGKIIVKHVKVNTSLKAPSQYMQEALQNVRVNDDLNLEGLKGFVGEIIETVWENKNVGETYCSVKNYGPPVKEPKCSIVIPIYGRSDFIFYQLAQMSKDPFMQEVEIIYVLDDPRIIDQFEKYATDSYDIFQLPFKTIQYGRNLGYAGANNMGSSAASSDLLLLLNSDIMPKEIGWLERLIEVYTQDKEIGVLGARLLFEDNTIQHDGLEYFKSPQYQSFWLIDHPSKGLPVSLAEPELLKQVDSVTGACLMISKNLYHEVEGLDESYAYGDFEDSDLCLKVLSLGFKNYIDKRVNLYHLERQSQNLFDDISWKFKLTIFNAIKHTERWDDKISSITKHSI